MTQLNLPQSAMPFLADYLGPWMIEDTRGSSILAGINRMDLAAHVSARQAAAPITADTYAPKLAMDGNIAIMEVRGTMTKYGSSLSSAPSSLLMQRAFRRLEQDDSVAGLMIVGDSPGGQAAGTGDAADALARLAAVKPVVAYIEDIGASAMYYLASQATRVSASPNAVVGSIGTYMVLYDTSAAAARDGYKAIVIKAGEFKGMGVDGAEVTDAQKAEFARCVNAANAQFVAAVQRGRRFTAEQATAIADGRLHIAADALSLNLIDAVETQEQAMQALKQLVGFKKPTPQSRPMSGSGAKPPTKEPSMSQEQPNDPAPPKATPTPPAPVAATAAELKSALPGSTAEFREECQIKGMTLAQAKDAHMANLAAQNQKLTADLAAKHEDKPKPQAKGNTPLGDGKRGGSNEDHGDAVQQWNSKLEAMVKGGMSRGAASSRLVREEPELHAAYLGAINPGKDHLVAARTGH